MSAQKRTFLNPEDIVISGISGAFPGCDNVAEFGKNLQEGKDMISSINRYHKEIRTGLLKTIDRFDHSFFHVTHQQVQGMLIASRLLLEKSFEAILDAGYNPQQIRGRNIAVICGVWDTCSEGDPAFTTEDSDDYMLVLGRSKFMIANRISFCLDLKGPSVSMNTACSSSMYAFDYAFHAIKSGRCEGAIVIAPNTCLSDSESFHISSMMESTEKTSPFDATTKGYTRSEAAVAIFLQKRKDARRIYANVLHTKTNCDGFKEEGPPFPSVTMQKELYRQFYKEAGISPQDISYLEAHGTGTQAGDVVEGNSIQEFFCPGRETPLKIGTVKSNMGHAEAASLLCSLVKMAISFETGFIPANLHYKTPNPKIQGLIDGRLQVITEPTPLKGEYHAVSSFGVGGAIGHLILSPNNKLKKLNKTEDNELPRLVSVSGRTKEAVDCILNDLETNNNDVEYIRLLHEVFSDNISGHLYRGYAISNNGNELSRSLKFFSSDKRPIWFVFCGMGSQWPSMGKSLMRIPTFAKSIRASHDILQPKGIDLIKVITDDNPQTLENILHCFVGIAAIQIALVDILISLNVLPDGIIGHSVGELACAYADGSLTAEQMIMAAYYRGLVSLTGDFIPGAMAAVGESYATMKDIVPPEIDIACHNSSSSCTISGPSEVVKNFTNTLLEKNIFVREVNSANIAYHSRYIKSAGPPLESFLKTIIPEPKLRSEKWICTSAPEQEWNSDQVKYSSAQYHTYNVLNPVYFEESCRHIPDNAIAIEIGPHGLLSPVLKRSLPSTVESIALTMRNHEDGVYFLLNALGRMYEVGCISKLSELYPPVEFPVSRSTPMISPLIKWQHDEQWPIGRLNSDVSTTVDRHFTINTNKRDFAFVTEHVLDGINLYPGMGYLKLVWETVAAMKKIKMIKLPIIFENVRFERATIVQKKTGIKFHVSVHMGTNNFQVTENQAVVASGKVRIPENIDKELAKPLHDDEIVNWDTLPLNLKDFYKEMKLRGYNYKGSFKIVTQTNMEGTRGKILWNDNFVTFMDGMMQITALQLDCRDLLVPTFVRKVIIDPKKHLEILQNLNQEEPEFPVNVDPVLKLSSSGGIQIRDWKFNEIARRKDKADAVIQKYQFVSYIANETMDLSRAVTICVQIAVENGLISRVKTFELFNERNRFEISTSILNTLRNYPFIEPSVNILNNGASLEETQIPNDITVLNEKLPDDKKSLIIIMSNFQNNIESLPQIFKALMDNGFIIVVEPLTSDTVFENFGLNVCFSRHINDSEKILLLNRRIETQLSTRLIKVTNGTYSWISQVQNALATIKSEEDEKMVVYAEKEPTCGILGFFNCSKWEKQGNVSRCFFIMDDNAPSFSLENPFYEFQFRKNLSHNVYKGGNWGSYRHLPVERAAIVKTPHAVCSLAERGNLSSFKWVEGALDSFKYENSNRENLVYVYYSSLNFKDIMLAVRKFSPIDLSYYNRLRDGYEGTEYSGKNEQGERIMGILTHQGIATMAEIFPELTWKVPDNMSLEEAASIPIVYATVIYAFFFKMNLRRGSSVLIHAGSGGIGLAAINICLHYDCDIFTTVGTAEKVEFIRRTYPQIPADHIASSRNTSFEDLIKKQTNGRGVDVVLNSLSEEKLQASLRCVAKRGTFLEIGKFDMTKNNSLELEHFLNEIFFISIHLDLFLWDKNVIILELQKKFQDLLDNGIIKPIPRTVFQSNEVESAFRYMANGKHTGKIVIRIRDEESDVKTKPARLSFDSEPRVMCQKNNTYVIVGGLGGVGMELADWLILRGARNIVLSSRAGIRKGYQLYRVKLWRSYGVNVEIFIEDVTKEQGVKNLLQLANSMGSVAGIFNLAVILQDNPISEQTEDSFKAAVAPKADITRHLDKLSRKMCPELEYFVVFSSVMSGYGNVNQTNYGFANSVMERICEARQADNLPALAVQWGAIAEAGIVADFAEDNISFVIGGTLPQKIKSCFETLNLFMKQRNTIVTSMITAEKRQIETDIISEVANILGIKDLKVISPSWTLPELGMDSIIAVELKQILELEFNTFFTPEDLRNMTFAKLYAMKEENKKEVKSGAKIKTQMEYALQENFVTKTIVSLPFETADIKEATNRKNPPVFIFPGIEGFALTVEPLVKNMNIRAFCFQYLYEKKENSSFSELCEYYSKLILENIDDSEEFNMIGHSLGGLFVIEVANILEKLGKKGRIWLIESSPAFIEMRKIEKLRRISTSNENYIQNEVCAIIIGILYPKLAKEKYMKDLEKVADWEAKKKLCFSMLPAGIAKENAIQQILDRIYRIYGRLPTFQVSQTVKIQTPCVLIRCAEDRFALDESYGLSQYFENSVQVYRINADHVSILMNPSTAQIIMQTLN